MWIRRPRAMLVAREPWLDFRRLAEKKGSPPIDWEDVLFVKKATEAQ